MCLADVENSISVKIIRFEGEAGLQTKLTQYGLYPGDIARVLRTAPFDGPVLIEVDGREIALGKNIAAQVIVEPL